jgi:PEP-CTERM motif
MMKTQLRIASLSLFAILCLVLAATSANAGTLYDNGPPNGEVDAWTINAGYVVSNSFVTPANSEITDVHFVYWDASTSDLLTTVDMQINGMPFGGAAQTLSGVTNTFLGTNAMGYNLYQADYEFAGIPYSGAGFLTLSNACTTSGCSTNAIYWDENSGVGCGGTHPPGGGANCPSTAYENTLGSIPSEAFTLTGQGGGGTTPEPSSLVLLGSGVLGIGGLLRRRYRA